VLALILSPVFAAFARRIRLVVAPRPDRWHTVPTPLLGGAAITVAALATIGALLDLPTAITVVICGAAAFAFGLLDDFRRLTPTAKLVGQVVIASLLFIGGIRVEIINVPPFDFVLTVFWVVTIMNAVNLMDNMDGLAAGIAAIAGIALALTAPQQSPAATIIGLATAGAALGFLVHNFNPARVFMGDAGSNLLGLLLAAAALLHTEAGAANVGIAVLAPVMVLALPIFDTALVTTSRRLAGKPIGGGGRDHTSHRLAALGLSDRGAVIMLYFVAAALAAVAVVADMATLLFLPLATLAVIALVLFGLFLVEVEVYGRSAQREPRSPIANALAIYGRFGIEVGLDVLLLTTSYVISYLFRFEGVPQSAWIGYLTLSLPFVVGSQLAALVLTGVYRTLWRFVGLSDAVRILRATALGTGGAALLLLLGFRFEGLSRAVFVLDWLLATALLIGSRGFLLWLRRWFAERPRTGERRALIIGATEIGAAAMRLVGRLEERSVRAVGILDDDVGMRHRSIAGVPIVGRTGDLEEVARRMRVDLVVLAVDPGHHAGGELRATCDGLGIEWREVVISGGRQRAAGES
jgi:UDP-GlcNAc:undecaprenyl-phosphate/decaprenyl-phosphate GlcNAc-1-phosphate transferase